MIPTPSKAEPCWPLWAPHQKSRLENVASNSLDKQSKRKAITPKGFNRMAKLSTLYLKNYRNIPEIKIDFEGRDGKIVGKNRVGKTNCLEAICYLLTDKLLGGSADIPSIKPQNNTRLKVEVEGTFITEDGPVTLRKEFYENWVKPRGSVTEELKGHITDYFINGAKQVRAKDFFDALSDKFGIPTKFGDLDAYQLMVDPFYLGETICESKDWKSARKAIIDIVEDVQPEEVYAANENAKIANEDLRLHQFNDVEAKKAIKGEIDNYKKKAIEHEGLINEYNNTLNQDVSDEEYSEAKAQEEKINEQIASLKTGAAYPYAEEVNDLQSELYELNNKYNASLNAPIDHSKSDKLRSDLEAKRREYMDVKFESQRSDYEFERLKNEYEEKKSLQEKYKTELKGLENEMKSIVVDDTCPTCGQKLPEEEVQKAVNNKKAEIIEKAQKYRDMALENKKTIDSLGKQIDEYIAIDYPKKLSEIQEEGAELDKKLQKALEEERAQVKTPDLAAKERIDQIHKRLSEIKQAEDRSLQSANSEIDNLKLRKSDLQTVFSKRIAADNARKRIEQLRKESSEIGKKQADAEQRFWAVGEFVKTKLKLLDKHMADKLGAMRFQLIKENIKEGSYDEVCVPYIIDPTNGNSTTTLFPDGSKSEQIYTGIQIIKAIRDAKGWQPLPIVFDQGGELDSKSTQNVAYDAEAQIIEVKVEGDNSKPTFIPFIGN